MIQRKHLQINQGSILCLVSQKTLHIHSFRCKCSTASQNTNPIQRLHTSLRNWYPSEAPWLSMDQHQLALSCVIGEGNLGKSPTVLHSYSKHGEIHRCIRVMWFTGSQLSVQFIYNWVIAAGLSLYGKASFLRVSWHWPQWEYGQTYHQDVPLCSGKSVEGYFTSMCAYSGKTEKLMQGKSFTGWLGLEHWYPSISCFWGIHQAYLSHRELYCKAGNTKNL